MKVLLCTGDSHTQGQGQDTFSDPLNGEWPVKSYDLVNGTGLGFKRLFDTNSYVNLIRHYLYEKTGSVEEQVSVDFLSEVEGEICFGCDGSDMFVFTIAEEQKEASLREVYEGAIDKMMYSIYTNYSTKDNPDSNGLLLHAVYNHHNGNGVDECNIWGYYYMEALVRLLRGTKAYW